MNPVRARACAQDMRFVFAQERLTKERLIPAMPAILERLKQHRAAVDEVHEGRRRKEQPRDEGKQIGLSLAKYPIGFCRHIRDEVWDRALHDPEFLELVGPEVRVSRVFILLKGQFFQNAVQMGNLYVDVANDTVWVHKPKLEWARLADVDYRNVETWAQFAEVARRYLKVELYPNLLFPLAFPIAPFFAIRSNGRMDLLLAQDILFWKDVADGMPRARALLADEKFMNRRLPPNYEELLQKTAGCRALQGLPLKDYAVGIEAIRDGVVAQFAEIGKRSPEQMLTAIRRYIGVVVPALKQLTLMNLRPPPAAVERLRSKGAIPALS